MPYTPTTWANDVAGATPITAAELNRMEAGIVTGAKYDHLITAADQAIQDGVAGTFVDVTGLTFNYLANEVYEFEANLYWTVAATTTGFRFGFASSTAITGQYALDYLSAATAWTTFSQNANAAILTPSMATVNASPFAVVPNILRARGYFVAGATGGTFKMRGASELTSASVTVKAGARLSYRRAL